VNTTNIATSKLRYGTIGAVTLEDRTFFYRMLTVREYGIVSSSANLDQTDMEEVICDWCVLDPQPPVWWDDYPAMTASMLAQTIVDESRFDTPDDLVAHMKDARERMDSNLLSFLIVKVCSAIPGYTPQELQHLTMTQLLDEVVYAEHISGQPILTEQIIKRVGRSPITNIPKSPQAAVPTQTMGRKWQMRDEDLIEKSASMRPEDALAAVMAGDREPDKPGTRIPG
jgi:hypothetical protein